MGLLSKKNLTKGVGRYSLKLTGRSEIKDFSLINFLWSIGRSENAHLSPRNKILNQFGTFFDRDFP